MRTKRPPCRDGSGVRDAGERGCAAAEAALDRGRRSDSGLPGARQAGPLDGIFDAQAGLAALRMRTKTTRDGVQERADDLNVRVRAGNLRLDAIDQLEHVFLITARESERTDRVVHGRQSLVYFCQLLGIHGVYFGPRFRSAQARRLRTDADALQRRAAGASRAG